MNNVTIEFEGRKLVVDPNRLLSIVDNSEILVNPDLETRVCICQLLIKATPPTKSQTPYFLK